MKHAVVASALSLFLLFTIQYEAQSSALINPRKSPNAGISMLSDCLPPAEISMSPPSDMNIPMYFFAGMACLVNTARSMSNSIGQK